MIEDAMYVIKVYVITFEQSFAPIIRIRSLKKNVMAKTLKISTKSISITNIDSVDHEGPVHVDG